MISCELVMSIMAVKGVSSSGGGLHSGHLGQRVV